MFVLTSYRPLRPPRFALALVAKRPVSGLDTLAGRSQAQDARGLLDQVGVDPHPRRSHPSAELLLDLVLHTERDGTRLALPSTPWRATGITRSTFSCDRILARSEHDWSTVGQAIRLDVRGDIYDLSPARR